jgi:hypothetical protein
VSKVFPFTVVMSVAMVMRMAMMMVVVMRMVVVVVMGGGMMVNLPAPIGPKMRFAFMMCRRCHRRCRGCLFLR